MKYETLTAKPDGYEKFSRLESKLLKPQFHRTRPNPSALHGR